MPHVVKVQGDHGTGLFEAHATPSVNWINRAGKVFGGYILFAAFEAALEAHRAYRASQGLEFPEPGAGAHEHDPPMFEVSDFHFIRPVDVGQPLRFVCGHDDEGRVRVVCFDAQERRVAEGVFQINFDVPDTQLHNVFKAICAMDLKAVGTMYRGPDDFYVTAGVGYMYFGNMQECDALPDITEGFLFNDENTINTELEKCMADIMRSTAIEAGQFMGIGEGRVSIMTCLYGGGVVAAAGSFQLAKFSPRPRPGPAADQS